ncbi:hypothetical protein ACROYT_G003175 [Oculina patagonica]
MKPGKIQGFTVALTEGIHVEASRLVCPVACCARSLVSNPVRSELTICQRFQQLSNMADEDDTTEGNFLHTNKPRQKKQSEKTKVSSRAKKPVRREEIKDEKQRLKELETSIRSQVAAEERAHNIVERLVLEDEVKKDFLINAGNFITTSHYADVVEERMLSKKCGYPLCNNELSQIPSQKYKICVKTNRVFDITERKCFCSNFCFKASKYFESQISASPVWTRIGESSKTFVLLESDSSIKSVGVEEDCITEYGGHDDNDQVAGIEESLYAMSTDSVQELTKDYYSEDSPTPNFLSSMSSSPSLTDAHDQSLDKPNQLRDKPNQLLDKPVQLPVKLDQLPDKPDQSLRRTPESSDSKSRFASKKERMQDNKGGSLSRDMIIQSVQAVFQEWCTHSTLENLGHSLKRDTDSVYPEAKEKDPDSFTTRVAQFYQPTMNAKEDSDSDLETEGNPQMAREDITIKEKKRLNWDPVCVVPPIDSKSQSTIRRRIVLDKLFRTMPELLSEVKLTVGEISRDLTELVHTFSLSSKNVTMKPFQWKIIALAMILILKRKNFLVSQALESSKKDFDALLSRLEITGKDIDQVLSPLSSFQPYHPGHLKGTGSNDEPVKTLETSGEITEVVFKQRNDYGDMEELD